MARVKRTVDIDTTKMSRDELAELYGTDVITSVFTPKLKDYWRKTTQMGQVFDIAWLSAVVKDEDGVTYKTFRSYQYNVSAKFYGQIIKPNGETEPMKVDGGFYKGYMWNDVSDDGKKIICKAYQDDVNSFEIEIEPQHYLYKEADFIDLEYQAVGPACRFITLGGEVDESVYYQVEYCKIEGTIYGKKVQGYGSLDLVYQTPATTWHQGKIYGFIEDMWLPFFTKYDNGDVYYGHFLKGRAGWSMGYYVKNGKAVINNDFTMDIKWTDDDFGPLMIDCDFDGQKFHWEPLVRVASPEDTRPTIGYAVGKMEVVGHPGEISDFCSDMEFRPHYTWGEAASTLG